MSAATYVTAAFIANIVNDAVTATANGSVTNNNVSQATSGSTTITTVTVNSGSSQSFSITPSAGSYVAGVTVDGASVGIVKSYTFSNITAERTISATFAATT